jgi:hypothetical protein
MEPALTSRLTDRFEQYPELEPESSAQHAALIDLVHRLGISGSVFHVVEHVVDQGEDLYTLLCDDQLVVSFEVPRGTSPLVAEEVSQRTVSQYRQDIGQGKKLIRLDRTLNSLRALRGQSLDCPPVA